MSIEELENLRVQTVKKCNRNILISVGVAIVIALFSIYVEQELFSFMLFFLLFAFVPTAIINDKYKNEYKNKFMKALLPIAVQSILKDVKVDVNMGIPSSLVASTHSMSTGDVYHSSNLVSGTYKDIKVTMSDIHIQTESTDSDGDTTYVTIFRGQWMIFDFNKVFKSNVQVWEKKVLGGISRRWGKELKKVELEDIAFNKKFKVYSENELDAFYIITPKLMERITQVEAAISGTLMMVFLNNQLHVAVYNNKTTFNVNIRKPINFEEFARDSIKDLDAIIKFADILDLDNDLFKVGTVDNTTSVVSNGVGVGDTNQGVVAANTEVVSQQSVQENSSIEKTDAVS